MSSTQNRQRLRNANAGKVSDCWRGGSGRLRDPRFASSPTTCQFRLPSKPTINSSISSMPFLPAVRQLGERHRGYGVSADHYGRVGAALLWTLEQGLGSAFTPEVKAAWSEAYRTLAGAMQE